MKRFVSALVLCVSLLALTAFIMTAPVIADGDVIVALLDLPAPPPPNPLVAAFSGTRPEEFFDKAKPPADDAPIEDLMAYWATQSSGYERLGHNIYPSDRVIQRISAEIARDPKLVSKYLNIFNESRDGAKFVKDLYDRYSSGEQFERGEKAGIRAWLKYNSPYFTEDLERGATAVGDQNEYVSNQEELLSLSRFDWERAAPIVNRLYSDPSQPVSRVLAMWAHYKHALETDSIGDIERYRSELMAVVEDTSATAGMRDLAFDALVKEKEWSGRDDWYYSLLADETLADFRVNGQSYTGLTTLVMYSPPEKYRTKMIEFAKSDNKTIRSAAVRNLLVVAREPDLEVTRALLPWLTNPRWVEVPNDEAGRSTLIRALQRHKMPEAVPGLIALLDEKNTEYRGPRPAANAMNAAANAAATAANMVANAANVAVYASNRAYGSGEEYPYRFFAVQALGFQGDPRANPPLRRVLAQAKESYQRTSIIQALVATGGFSIPEQVNAIEFVSKLRSEGERLLGEAMNQLRSDPAFSEDEQVVEYLLRSRLANMASNSNSPFLSQLQGSPDDSVEFQIGEATLANKEPSEALVRAVVDRISALDKTDPKTAAAMRKSLVGWQGMAVNAMLLRDLKNGKSSVDAIVRLLTIRKELREKQMGDVYDANSGVPTAAGITACIIEDQQTMSALLSADRETAATVLACARLIRGKLPVDQVVPFIRNEDKRLALAAERYLESEDSPEARAAVLSLHPNEAKILGAKQHFPGGKSLLGSTPQLAELFASVGPVGSPYPDFMVFKGSPGKYEDKLANEAISDTEILGIYSYGEHLIRIFKDRVVYARTEDVSRYRERALTGEEFDDLKRILTENNADSLPPFLGCYEDCQTRELIMVGRNGGRRVYMNQPSDRIPALFADLDKFFDEIRQRSPMRLRYSAEKDLPGLEVIYADDAHSVETVWKNGEDMRVLVKNVAVRKKLQKDLQEMLEAVEYGDDTEPEDEYTGYEKIEENRTKRQFEGYQWFGLSTDGLGEATVAPPEIEFPPLKDNLEVTPEPERWKTVVANAEIRADENGLYKVVQGKLTKLRSGNYRQPIVSSNGRWIFAQKMSNEYIPSPVRINILTGREYPVDVGGVEANSGVCYIPAVNRFLLSSRWYGDYHGHEGEGMEIDIYRERSDLGYLTFSLLDPETGNVQESPGEVRPLVHQTIRKLQPAGKPTEFWAALPDSKKNETVVGVYDSQFFNFKPVVRVPKIIFDSMDMWADPAAGKVYFVYKGHLLAAPLYKPQ